MRISDWSSDVCSSDLGCGSGRAGWRPRSVSIHGPCGFPNRGQSVSCRAMTGNASGQGHDGFSGLVVAGPTASGKSALALAIAEAFRGTEIGRAACRGRGWQSVEVSVVAGTLKTQIPLTITTQHYKSTQ